MATAAALVAGLFSVVGGTPARADATIGSATGPLTSASLLTATHHSVGNVFLYTGGSPWLFMSVDMGSGNEPVTCQLVGADGQVTTLGSFQLADGYGSWGSPDPGTVTPPRGARLVSAAGTVLATATFTR